MVVTITWLFPPLWMVTQVQFYSRVLNFNYHNNNMIKIIIGEVHYYCLRFFLDHCFLIEARLSAVGLMVMMTKHINSYLFSAQF